MTSHEWLAVSSVRNGCRIALQLSAFLVRKQEASRVHLVIRPLNDKREEQVWVAINIHVTGANAAFLLSGKRWF